MNLLKGLNRYRHWSQVRAFWVWGETRSRSWEILQVIAFLLRMKEYRMNRRLQVLRGDQKLWKIRGTCPTTRWIFKTIKPWSIQKKKQSNNSWIAAPKWAQISPTSNCLSKISKIRWSWSQIFKRSKNNGTKYSPNTVISKTSTRKE